MSSVPEKGRNNTIRHGFWNENIRPSCPSPQGGDLVVCGDVPVAKFRVSNSAIYYLLGSKKFQTLLPLRVVKIDMIRSQRCKKV